MTWQNIGGGASTATSTTYGTIKLAGDLGGTADSPDVVGLTGASGTVAISATTLRYAKAVSSPAILHEAHDSDALPSGFSITSQAPWASATGVNRSPGNLGLVVPPSVGGQPQGNIDFTVNSATILRASHDGTNGYFDFGTSYHKFGATPASAGRSRYSHNDKLIWRGSGAFDVEGLAVLSDVVTLGDAARATTLRAGGKMIAYGSDAGANMITYNLNAAGYSGIEYRANDGATPKVFTGYSNGSNHFRFNALEAGNYIVFMRDGNEKVRIDENRQLISCRLNTSKGADIASAADVTLGVDGNFFVFTGTTEVQRIAQATWSAGAEVRIRASGNMNVKHGVAAGGGFGGIYLAGAVDYAMTANDMLALTFDGTNWYEHGRAVI